MEFNELQVALWGHMLEYIDNYRQKKIGYSEMVNGLEHALFTGDFYDKDLTTQWFDRWEPLEEWNAVKGNNVTPEDVDKFIDEMQRFLEKIRKELPDSAFEKRDKYQWWL